MCLSQFPPPQVFHIPEKDFQVIQIKTWKSSFISSFLLSIPNICQQDLEILSPSFTPHHLRSVWHHILFILLEPPLKKCYWNIVDLQCCASFRCAAKWITYMCVCVSNSSQPHGQSAAWQTLLTMELSKQEYWSGLPFPTPGDLPDSGIKPTYLACPALAGRISYIYTYIHSFFLFFSHIGHYRVLSIVPWALQ